MKSIILTIFFMFTFIFPTTFAAQVTILCYHEVDQPTVVLNNAVVQNDWNISSKNLKAHFEYLRNNGYQVLSIDDYINGNYSGDKNVIISFDDGYESFYTKVFPMLKEYNYQATLALHNEWFAYKPSDVGNLVTMQQLHELNDSGLVTLASHTYSSHKNKSVNPQGSVASIMENRLYMNDRYETDAEFESRLNNDFASAQKFFLENFHKTSDVIVWPYGRYSGTAAKLALQNNFKISFLLNGGVNVKDEDNIFLSKRYIIYNDPNVQNFAKALQNSAEYWLSDPMKMAQVDLDALYDSNIAKLDENVDILINNLKQEKYNVVALQAFCDDKGDGIIESVYFHTNHAPVKADVFAHIANKLSQAGIRVIAWMPTLSAAWLSNEHPESLIKANPPENIGWYKRATPFSQQVENKLIAVYSDLANYTRIDGILIQDDLYMNDFEDFSMPARKAFLEKYGYELTTDSFQHEQTKNDLLKLKIEQMDQLTNKLKVAVQQNRPEAVFMRNIYAEAVLNPEAITWYAQDYQTYLTTYDYTVIMAYPYMEGQEKDPNAWLRSLAKTAGINEPKVKNKLIFKLQKYDWKTNRDISEKELSSQIQALKQSGVKNIAVYPENISN